MQEEMCAAVECIREIFPLSSVKTVCTHSFRPKVVISTDAFGKSQEVWSGRQLNLKSRNPKRRRKAMDLIKECLAQLRETLSLG